MAAKEAEFRWTDSGDIEIQKWKVRKGSMVSKGSVLGLYMNVGNGEKSQSVKLKSKDSGIVVQINAQEGTVVHPGDLLLVIHPQTGITCTHPTIMKDMCADCGADLRCEMGVAGDRKKTVSASVAMVHSIPELIVSQEQALELGKEDENRLLRERKLVLLVDLDQTLVHTTNDNIPPNLKDVKHFQLWHGKNYMWYHTRIRPFTPQFLETISKMYELHICTFGVRMYAHMIARLLDPDEKYFSHRILSRDECFDPLSKTANLKALFPCGDKMVGIIDDREDVWNHAPNLVHVKPYRFFQGTADINAPPGLTKSEHDNEPISHKLIDQLHQPNKSQLPNLDRKDEHTSTSPDIHVKITSGDSESKNVKDDVQKSIDQEETRTEKTNISSVEMEVTADVTTDFAVPCSTAASNVKEFSLESLEQIPQPGHLVSPETGLESPETGLESPETGLEIPETGLEITDILTDKATTDTEVILNPAISHSEKMDDLISADLNNEENVNPSLNHTESKGNSECKIDKMDLVCEQNNQEVIEWADDDDYLLHLEEILTRIHKAYYGMYEQYQRNGTSELPDLKNIIPYVRKKTLKGANIVFSGMFPLNMGLEKSLPYSVAKALGANIKNDIVPRKTKTGNNTEATTHLVAAKPGTGKHKTALKAKGMHIVNGDWLWSCNERWEWVDETCYPLVNKDQLSKNTSSPSESSIRPGGKSEHKKRKNIEPTNNDDDDDPGEKSGLGTTRKSKKMKLDKQEINKDSDMQSLASTSNAKDTPVENFASSFNPLYSFSDEDIEFMDKEVDELMDEDGVSSDETDEEREARIRQEVLRRAEESDSDSESLSGDLPRGLKMHRKSLSPNRKDNVEDEEKETDACDDDETENELVRYQKNMAAFAGGESGSESEHDDDSIGSVDDEIAEAVEKEFLSSL